MIPKLSVSTIYKIFLHRSFGDPCLYIIAYIKKSVCSNIITKAKYKKFQTIAQQPGESSDR